MSVTGKSPYRVLALDGGGMRGLYTVILLQTLAIRFARSRGVHDLDIGKGFDLITGTSTGGILACALARGIPIAQLVNLYRENGPKIFIDPIPSDWATLAGWGLRNAKKASANVSILKQALVEFFNDETLEELFNKRKIALCIPTVNMATQKSWVFKTPHTASKRRDDKYKIVDVCLATSAAPMFLPIASVTDPDDPSHDRTFVDGGLWANNPVLIGLIEALEISPPGRAIEILSIGTCAPPEGHPVHKSAISWGVWQWRFGSKALSVALNAQSAGYSFMAEFLSKHLDRPCRVVRLPQSPPSPDQAAHLALDKATEQALDVLSELGKTDADGALRLTQDVNNLSGQCLLRMFNEIPATSEAG
jgi:hypothetical protein